MSPGFHGPRDGFDATDQPSVTEGWSLASSAPRRASIRGVVELAGIEPATSALQRRRSPS